MPPFSNGLNAVLKNTELHLLYFPYKYNFSSIIAKYFRDDLFGVVVWTTLPKHIQSYTHTFTHALGNLNNIWWRKNPCIKCIIFHTFLGSSRPEFLHISILVIYIVRQSLAHTQYSGRARFYNVHRWTPRVTKTSHQMIWSSSRTHMQCMVFAVCCPVWCRFQQTSWLSWWCVES